MLIIGLTGSIGMGKSTAAAHLRSRGIAVFDADAAVHELYAGKAVSLVEAAFPGTTAEGKVDRQKLAAALLTHPGGFKRLEAIVHPLVRAEERAFLAAEAARGAAMAVLEIPLLFETKADEQVDVVIVMSAPAEEQRRRVLKRPGMTAAKLDQLLSRQLPDAEKRSRADFVVDTDRSVEETYAQLDRLLGELRSRRGTAFRRHWR
jgi:dephospho-CoA kinase